MTATQLWTTAEAAAVAGVQPDSFRSLMRKARQEGIDLRADRARWPDQRTPMYDARRTLNWLDTRPRGTSRDFHIANRSTAAGSGAEITELIAVVPHPEHVDPDALREALTQSGYRVGEVSVVLSRTTTEPSKNRSRRQPRPDRMPANG